MNKGMCLIFETDPAVQSYLREKLVELVDDGETLPQCVLFSLPAVARGWYWDLVAPEPDVEYRYFWDKWGGGMEEIPCPSRRY